jgi:hypothetical protein
MQGDGNNIKWMWGNGTNRKIHRKLVGIGTMRVTTTTKSGMGSGDESKPHHSIEDVGRKKKWLR